MTQEQMRNLNTIVETYGNDAQEDMAIEECSELVKAILKFRRSDEKTAEMREAVIDEIADVQIMLTQLGIIFNCVACCPRRRKQSSDWQIFYERKMQSGDFNAYGLLHHEFAV